MTFTRQHITTAPEAADYSHTTTVEVLGTFHGRTVRLVETEADTEDRLDFLVEYQQGRYCSFCGGIAMSPERWKDEHYETLSSFEPATP